MIERVGAEEFGRMFRRANHLFNGVGFAEHNRGKCDEVHYLLTGGGKVTAGIILGMCEGVLHNPFSAPFGGLLTNRRQGFEAVDAAWADVVGYARAQGAGLRVTLPPAIYSPDLTAKSTSALLRQGLSVVADVSYHVELQHGSFGEMASAKCRAHLRQAMEQGLHVSVCGPSEEAARKVYAVISANHAAKGRPMWMSEADVVSTSRLVGAEFFLLTSGDTDVAGAMIYPVAEGVRQVIYWGDRPGCGELHPMQLLAERVHEHYREQGIAALDLGPATEQGVPNYGLCTFKEALGAVPTLKPTFRL